MEENLNQEAVKAAELLKEEEKLYKTARKRVGFKKHLVIYLLVNLFVWVVWFFVFRVTGEGETQPDRFLQAILFLTIAWGIALVAHYLIVYKWNKSLIEKEVQRLKKEQEKLKKELESLQQ